MPKKEDDDKYIVYNGWVEKRSNGTAFVIVQGSDPRNLNNAIVFAMEVGG